MLLNCGVGEDSWESLGLQGDPTVHPKGNQSLIFIGRTDAEAENPILWAPDAKNQLIEKPLMLGKIEGRGEGDDRGWDGWMASPTWWTRVWASSRSWWWTGKPGVLQSMGSQRVGHDWATELNWILLQGRLDCLEFFLFPPTTFQALGASSVQFSRSVVSDSLRPHGLQHARLSCPSPTPGACSNSCPSSHWCHQTISSTVVPFSSCLQSFPASRSFLMSQFFTSGNKVLELQLQHQSFQWIFRTNFL